ncbi:MAG: xanthine dehydrogenase family protein molybdopterin-binding subunit [Acidimicrobiales bacterium]|nr:xanthine dehydrogenase family protein molybdopterin-binding subunit [Acidimicrobiales bacterium]MYB82321.1 xanthine dehydrogenase family protein molybdopterin-binding subunit [Acidimicrobiales bacterium]MYI11003.1 xanthine dehydrogenase family protein molybdopterin-binding subunit [Acidimicrobiales bacterium]
MTRSDASLKVSGTAPYAVDVALAGMLHAKVLRSPHAHALVTRIDTTAAEQAPGVRAVLTRRDLLEGEHRDRWTAGDVQHHPSNAPLVASHSYGYFIKDQPVLALERVRCIGDPVVAIAAETELDAARALSLVQVAYEPLPAVTNFDEALAPDAPEIFPEAPLGMTPAYGQGASGGARPRPNVCYRFGYETGDPAAFQGCDHVFTDVFAFDGRQQHLHLEPFVAVARWSAQVTGDDSRLELWSSCQNPFPVRKEMARLLGIGEQRVRMHVGYLGGGFGAKNGCKTEPIAALLALKAGAPVRYCLTLDEGFWTMRQHNARLTLRTGVMADGTLVARDAVVLLDAGAYADASPLVAEKAGYRVAGPYRWQHIRSVTDAVLTNTTPAGPFRGFGGTQANFACESQIDMIADRLGMDPVELRRRNLIRLGEPYVPGESAMDSDLVEGLDLVASHIGMDSPRPAGRGRGVAVGFKDSGGVNKPAQARVKVATSGDAWVQCGTVEMGQGSQTALREVAARVLGVSRERVHWSDIDTDHTPFDQGTNASSAISVMGQAVQKAAEAARLRVLQFSATALDVPVERVDFRDGFVVVTPPDGSGEVERRPLAPLVMGFYGGTGYEFTGEGFFKAPTDHRAPLESPCVSWEYGWGAAEVSVDAETGAITVHRLVVSGDAGAVLHEGACRGQDEGASIMGLGGALFETMRFDGPVLTNGRLVDYRVPRASDLPAEFVSITQEQGHGPGPFGSKGLGEGAMLPIASAIANAVADATGARVTSMPLTPETVLAALDGIRGEQ